jgi:hypothetical protein
VPKLVFADMVVFCGRDFHSARITLQQGCLTVVTMIASPG